jgi:hypothetical protein
LWVVPRRDVIRVDNESRARAVVRELAQEPGALEAMLREAGIDPMPGTTEGDAEAELVRALASGRVMLVRTDEMPRLGRPAHDVDPATPEEPIVPLAPTKSIRLSVVDYTGIPYAGLTVDIDFPDGHREKVTLDKLGRWYEEHVAGPGSCRVVFPSTVRLTAEGRRDPPLESFSARPTDLEIPPDAPRPQSLALGTTHRIVVQPPAVQTSYNFRGGLFAFDSAFPTAGISQLVKYAHESFSRDKNLKYGIFAHSDVRGDEGYNKHLADRRAKIAFAILTGDFETFQAVAKQEPWTTDHYQSLLRSLGANPGAIDGVAGDLTSLAVARFRRDYNLGLFHRFSAREPVFAALPDGDSLDDATKNAILDAWHADVAGALEPSLFAGPKFSGCGEFNPVGADDGENRRVTLAVYGSDAPSDFPCQSGDVDACEVDSASGMRCRFYRERIREEQERDLEYFYDFEWLRTPTGKAHLSAITTLPDTNDAEIIVQLCESGAPEEESGKGDAIPKVGLELARIPALIRKGIAYGLWDYPDDWDPFDVGNWFGHPGAEEGRPWLPGYNPPAFGVRTSGNWGWGGTPGQRLDRIHFTRGGPPFVVVRNDGKLVFVDDEAALRQLGAAAKGLSLILNNGEES